MINKILSDKVLSNKLLSDKEFSDKLLSDKVLNNIPLSDKELSNRLLSDKILSDETILFNMDDDKIKDVADKHLKCWEKLKMKYLPKMTRCDSYIKIIEKL